MTVAVRYYSQTGNTKMVAKEIAKQLNVEAKDISFPLSSPVDKLFLGGAIHMASVDGKLKKYAEQLTPAKIGEVVMFGTSGAVLTIETGLSRALDKNNIKIAPVRLFLHGMIPDAHKLNENQKEKITNFVKEAKKES